MSVTNPYTQYIDNQVLTSTPNKLLVLTYDAAIRFARFALEQMKARNYEEKNTNIKNVQAILYHLKGTLNPDADAKLAASLDSLYAWMLNQLLKANIKNDSAALENVIDILIELRSAWAEAESNVRNGIAQAA
jgi:flagellar secretion chaperone FliS